MKTHSIILSLMILLLLGCSFVKKRITQTDENLQEATKLETPFVTVVKLVSTENTLHLEEAMQYIDVVRVYTKLGSKNPKEDWEKFCRFQYNFGRDKKNTNDFGYYNYDINEIITGNNARVCFKAKDNNSNVKMITYGLEKRQQKWVVISIDYTK